MRYKNLEHAVEASIEIWKVLAKLGCMKIELPTFHAIEHLQCECPLCDYFNFDPEGGLLQVRWCRKQCPLESCQYSSCYSSWHHAACDEDVVHASFYAQKIVNKLKDYFVYEQMYTDYTEIEMREG